MIVFLKWIANEYYWFPEETSTIRFGILLCVNINDPNDLLKVLYCFKNVLDPEPLE